jgi:hypothetical protein
MCVADFGDDIVAAHQRLLVVAGLSCGIAASEMACRRRDQEELALDAGLDPQPMLGGFSISASARCAAPAPPGRPSIHADRPRPRPRPASTAAGSGSGSGMREHVGIGRRQVEPGGEAGEAGAVLLHVGDRLRRHQLGALLPNRSVKEIMKYLMPRSLGEARGWRGPSDHFVPPSNVIAVPSRKSGRGPVRSRSCPESSLVPASGTLGHGGGLDRQRARDPPARDCAGGSCRRRGRWSAPPASSP